MDLQKQYMSVYTFTYAAVGVLSTLISQYLDGIGFSGAEIGTITAAGTFVSIFATAFWGKVYSASRSKHMTVMLMLLAAAGIALIVMNVKAYPLFLLLFGAMYFFQSPAMSLSDALCLDDGQMFGSVRTFGAIGFAAASFIGAYIAQKTGLRWIFPMYVVCYLAAAAFIFSIDRRKRAAGGGSQEEAAEEKKTRGGYLQLLHNRKYVMLVLSAFFIYGPNIAHNTYFSFLYLKGGGELAGVGLAFFLMAESEAPVMAWTTWLEEKITVEKLLLIAMIVSIARFCWYGSQPPYYLLLALFFTQGIVNGIILVEFIRYVHILVGREQSGVGIAAYYAFLSCSTISCQLIGGVVLDDFGAGGVYLFFAGFNVIGLVLHLAFGLHRKKQ
ncbi:MAG: MFS transporter [Anaerovoracaceae bacterium]|jgi:PPP family 3-phenylpropionic acid transporter